MNTETFRDLFPHVGAEFRAGAGGKKGPKALSRLFQNWHRVLTEYAETETDFGYWYNERATLSTLAAASWRLGKGFLALEEYSTLRQKKKGVQKRGRCDLWLDLAGFHVVLEAKAYWPRQPTQSIVEREVQERLDEALVQVKELATTEEADWFLAGCFVAPWLSTSKYDSEQSLRETGREVWQCLYDSFGDDSYLIDVYECPPKLLARLKQYHNPDRLPPGVALVLQRYQP